MTLLESTSIRSHSQCLNVRPGQRAIIFSSRKTYVPESSLAHSIVPRGIGIYMRPGKKNCLRACPRGKLMNTGGNSFWSVAFPQTRKRQMSRGIEITVASRDLSNPRTQPAPFSPRQIIPLQGRSRKNLLQGYSPRQRAAAAQRKCNIPRESILPAEKPVPHQRSR